MDYADQTVSVSNAPTVDSHVANKAYVDNAVSAAGDGYSGVSMISAKAGSTMTHANAASYCWNLSASASASMDGDTTTVYTDWRLPTVEEGAIFEGTVNDADYIWTATVRDASASDWILLRLSDGGWTGDTDHYSNYVRCVR